MKVYDIDSAHTTGNIRQGSTYMKFIELTEFKQFLKDYFECSFRPKCSKKAKSDDICSDCYNHRMFLQEIEVRET